MDETVFRALGKWIEVGGGELGDVRRTTERLLEIETGPTFDFKRDLLKSDLVTVKLAANTDDVGTVWTVQGHVVDVPSDGNCGFHAFSRAASQYGGRTSTGRGMPVTSRDCRSTMIEFMRARRQDIEQEVISALGTQSAKAYLWRDIDVLEPSDERISFSNLCRSLLREGLRGHWLGSVLGEVKLHLLGRALGVTIHCVGTGQDPKGNLILRQTVSPNQLFWTGRLSGNPKGAVVLRFLGDYTHGHYQIVHCSARPPVRIGSVHLEQANMGNCSLVNMSSSTPLQLRKWNSIAPASSIKKRRDIEAIRSMHGIQLVTKKRYTKDYKIIDATFLELKEQGKDPLDLHHHGMDVINAIIGILMQRCGPKRKGYEGLSAASTGRVILAAVASWDNGVSFSDTQSCVVDGNAVRGPPWKAPDVLDFKESLDKAQAKARAIPIRRAYQLTHDDVAAAMRAYVASQLGDALNPAYSPGTNPSVNWLYLQTALAVTASFGSGCRGAEILSIRLSDLLFFSEGTDTVIGATLHGVKSKKGCNTRRKVLFPAWTETSIISPSMAILTQIAIVIGVNTLQNVEPDKCFLFPAVIRNQVQRCTAMSSDIYSSTVKQMFMDLGITDSATEHSPRRGGPGFRFYVLGENPDYIRDILRHSNIAETLVYIGFHDPHNSYVAQGYGTCGSRKIR